MLYKVPAFIKYLQYKRSGINVPLRQFVSADRVRTQGIIEKMKARYAEPRTSLDKDGDAVHGQVKASLQAILSTKNDPDKCPYFFSNALRKEIVITFQSVIGNLETNFKSVNYLEIGSALGASMSIVGLLLKNKGMLGSLTSVDPYFQDGYVENGNHTDITKRDRDTAQALYKRVGLDVTLFEEKSLTGLKKLLKAERKFDLIYIDGWHTGLDPLIELGLAMHLISPNGVIMLDDHYYPDVHPIKLLCDGHLEKVHESWKIAAYRIRPNSPYLN